MVITATSLCAENLPYHPTERTLTENRCASRPSRLKMRRPWGTSASVQQAGNATVGRPEASQRLTGAMQTDAMGIGLNVLMVTFFGVLPLVLLSLPASVTDRCIALETRLSDLLIPNDPNSRCKKGRYVVSFETSQQLQILEKYMRYMNPF